jgi:glycosyl transferase family 25
MAPTSVFVVNLPQQAERREFISAQLKVAGIGAEIIEAVDGRRLSAQELAACYREDAAKALLPGGMTAGEVGCALSHLSIYRRMLERGLPWAVVMEDDALLGRDFRPVLNAVVQQLDSSRPEICLFSLVDKYTNWGRKKIVHKYWLVRPMRAHSGHCYLLTSAAAKALLEFNYPVHSPIDNWMYFGGRGIARVRAVVPYCVGWAPCEKDSTIEPERKTRDAEPAGSPARRLRQWCRTKLYERFLYQLGIKQILRVKKQRHYW